MNAEKCLFSVLLPLFLFYFYPLSGIASEQTSLGNGRLLIRLGQAHFDPLEKYPMGGKGLDDSLEAKAEIDYFIVQFAGPIKQSWKEALVGNDAELFDYIPDFAFIVRMGSDKVDTVRSLEHVRWLGPYESSYKFSRGTLNERVDHDRAYPEQKSERNEDYSILRVVIFPGEDVERIKEEISSMNATIIRESIRSKWDSSLTIRLPLGKIDSLGSIRGVKWIAPAPKWRLNNNVSADIIRVGTTCKNRNLYGEGQTVGICDTGLDKGLKDPENLHKDFLDGKGLSRVVKIFDILGREKIVPDTDGHGTHVAGSVLGNGTQSGSNSAKDHYPSTCFSGMAPKAKLIFQAQGDTPDHMYPPLNEILDKARTAGADLHTNSWGSALGSSYSSQSKDVDQYIWDHRDFLVLFSAGNAGVDKDGDGVIDLYSLDMPGTAKNCLTVGASEGYRPSGCGYDKTWGGAWPFHFSAPPVFSDHVSNNPVGIAGFSARGPVLDGRYKPDLVAPGTNILSTRSSVAEKPGWGKYNDFYLWNGGTSMSTPITAGTAALVREYLKRVVKITQPSAALLKAAILNGAQDITPGQYGTGNTREIPDSPVPNNVEGWGRLNLEKTVYPQSPMNILYYDEKKVLQTGDSNDHHFSVVNGALPLKINVTWTDYPGSEIAQGGLVNDLDVVLTSPSKKTYYANNAIGKSTLTTLKYTAQNLPSGNKSSESMAVRFTPSAYPANLESVLFVYSNPQDDFSDVSLVVYDDKGPEGLPGKILFEKVFKYIPPGEDGDDSPSAISLGIAGVVINQGDFYVAIEKNNPNQLLCVEKGNDTRRSYRKTGSNWVVSDDTVWIVATVRGMNRSTHFDRVNNVLGFTLPNPEAGAYTLRVTGYNVPKGPQAYALVARGGIGTPKPRAGSLNFESAEYDTSENAGSARISVARTGGRTGALSVEYCTEDGTAKAGSDYRAVSGTLYWADEDQTPKEFLIPLLNDNMVEDDETVTLLLQKSSENSWLNSVESAVLNIEDNDGTGNVGSGGCFIDSLGAVR